MTSSRQSDELFLRRALELAQNSFGQASPNPNVGAVLVHSDQIIGEGFHTYDGLKHAEILAIEQARDKARGAILYINLEPCSHHGRTGPCTEALIAAGIRRVVACTADPNPTVSGRGFARLRQAGVQVASGILEEEARPLNDAFAKYIRYRLPLVTLKAGMTLDGKIAPPPEDLPAELDVGGPTGGWITSDEARAHVQQLRHQHDAILVGVGTVIADNPLLTDRSGLPRRRPLLRVIVDSHLRMPLDSRVAQTAKNDVLVFCSFAEEKKKQNLRDHGIEVEQVAPAGADGRPDLQAICRRLAEREITSIMIEGGALVNWTALESRVADKVFLYYAPRILAGTGSVPFAAGPGFRKMSEAAHLKGFRLHRFGEDFAVEGYLRDPYLD
ncbi:MAG: bifunctional diaminohydroxyphosphoribosylaminopyrimidine deaminase/5-amino-6-(5-phosphoribosylamino)uracil reductase RibD [Acidobacteria bacterium]|nr:MAG: bifunctional diaminohydroxyphosphoribosylaminopyrimidine deaminase/5-amino-6-(5-phosphoribosylamino)uracil reductase RibD [Acidobacteriota bacterium]PYV71586.1 MAG: bifunctional diaminohydroxyphosphoribosylaminopyrimidine deaminase/5-amino-6-(5-phosphoribosylamino)uracil reductase RibD [Acidobacteriota bacterium]PYV76296.1 MAG: bifunctional diaminohydroxyphosphoribosylaminopyrimidine deaminase/5-amino-6-(5-phosphoribosylamino)uracil reductase RibD [Acidobacteriota bacterium]